MGLADFLTGTLGSSNTFSVDRPYDGQAIQQQYNHQGQVYDQQQMLAQALQAQAAGIGPSASQAMLGQALQQQQGAAASMAAGNRGINPGLAMRQALQAQNQAGQQATAQGITARMQEQTNAQGQLGNLYGTMGNQSLGSQALMNNANNNANQINSGVAKQNTDTGNNILGSLIGGGSQVGAAAAMPVAAAHGAMVPGEPVVAGDSPKNDIVPAVLSPGEIVIPRSKASDPEKAKEFVEHLMKKKSKKGSGGFGRVLEAHRALTQALSEISPKEPK